MKHVWALLIKFTMIGIVLFSLLGIFTTASFGAILFMSILLTALAYMVGDLLILPKFGNVVASMADFGLSFLTVWFLSVFFFENSEAIMWTSLIAAAAIAAVEALFHIYLYNRIFSDSAPSFIPGVYQRDKLTTEFSEEIFPQSKNKEQDPNKQK